MDVALIAQMALAAVAAIALYTLIGFVPGTDETSVLLPVTLALVLAGIEPVVVLTFFVAAVVTLNLTNAIPTALVGLPGGVLSAPMLDAAITLKRAGRAAEAIKRMAVGSAIGTVVAIPASFGLAGLLAPFAPALADIGSLVFVFGAVLLALLGRNRILSLLAIVPLAILFQGVTSLYRSTEVIPEDGSITISFFLAITAGPLLVSILELLNTRTRAAMPRGGPTRFVVGRTELAGASLRPGRILDRAEGAWSGAMSLASSALFFLSPVGLTTLLGEASAARVADPTRKAFRTVTTMSALSHATYLSGLIIPLLALGIPLSPVAIGPANALFNAPPVLTLDNNLHHLLGQGEFVAAVLVGAIPALVLTYIIAVRYSYRITRFVMRRIPHEAVLGLFVGFILFLAYLDAGFANVFGVLLVGITCGALNRLGVNFGVQFMVLYASPWLVGNLW